MSVPRGKIKNREYARRIKDFSGLRWDNCTPTDVDGLLELDDKLFIFLEGKYGDAELRDGQRIALERTCKAIASTGRLAVVLVTRYYTSPDVDVDYANCPVAEMWRNGAWHKAPMHITCREMIDYLIQEAGVRLSQPLVLGGPGYH